MAVTRARGMIINDEIKDYITNLIEPLVTNDSIANLFDKFKEELILNLEKRINDQNRKIEKLESNLAIRENTINVLLNRLDSIEVVADNNEQYSRRSCLRIHGIEYEDGNIDNSMDVLEKCYEEVKVPFNKSDIDRVHRIGKTTQINGKSTKSIIVKFKSWESRKKFYQARPKIDPKSLEKPGSSPFIVSLDLTKRRYDLLKYAKGIINDNDKVAYGFADINCSLGIKTSKGKFCYFNTKCQLDDLLNEL